MEEFSDRKRSRDVDDISESLDDSDLARNTPIQCLSLEAIFHPKFENENRESMLIRREMKEKVNAGKGYLEVSIKHSGNLLLWSGSQRYYSKNSMGNAFTYIGEILLRQHFFRSWYSSKSGEEMYKECSDFVEKNRLTLAFEAVTSVLGHHGDLPKKDFLILTAVADRSLARFYDTVEVLEFSQRYRLPHNDLWVNTTLTSVDKLFSLYDNIRETGLAGKCITALNSICDTHVSSMYPHVDFQGEILEGIVIRYVSFIGMDMIECMKTVNNLEISSTEILKLVPVDTPMAFELAKQGSAAHSPIDEVICTNIREVYRSCIEKEGYTNLTTRVGDAVNNILKATDSVRRRTIRNPNNDWDIPQLAKSIMQHNSDIDEETKRIASLIVKLDGMNATVRYPVFHEENGRMYCIVHVLHDKTFFKYQKQMSEQDLNLYRGFSIELDFEKKTNTNAPVLPSAQCSNNMMQCENCGTNLMLKMKLLPYMVRTFCCRNGMRIISLNGTSAFENYTLKMMDTWQISAKAQAKWQPFFCSWGQYVQDVLNGASKPYIDKSLPPLTAAFYLNHLEHFTPWFQDNKIKPENAPQSSNSSVFKAMVLVVAMERAIALKVANYISEKIGGVYIHHDISTLTEVHLINMRVPQGGGLIAYASIEEGTKSLKKYLKAHGKHMSIILFGCDDDTIKSTLSENTDRLVGVANSWRKLRVGLVIEIARAALFGNSDDIDCEGDAAGREYKTTEEMNKVLVALNCMSNNVSALDNRTGVLVFFPCIPGSGKSTLSSAASRYAIADLLSALDNGATNQSPVQRKLIVLVGDEIKKKYWTEVKRMRAENPSSLFIADKNTPPNVWGALPDSAGHGVIVPVIYRKALSTTRVTGSISPAGEVDSEKCHCYPFSLHYLALCLARVLTRIPGTHAGGLDNKLPNAAMIVINFFGFYQHITAEDFFDTIKSRVEQSGGRCCSPVVEVDFFTSTDLLDLPSEVSEALVDALRLRHGYQSEKKDVTRFTSSPTVQEMELRLREIIGKYKRFIFALEADEGKSRKEFIDQIVDIVKVTNDEDSPVLGNGKNEKSIKIVSVDITLSSLQNVIKGASIQETEIDKALKSLGIDVETSWVSNCPNGIVQDPHVTMAHYSEFSQREMKSTFTPVLDNTIPIHSTSFFWNEDIAALGVEVATTSKEGVEVPPSANNFVHITVWKRESIRASDSNKLPNLVEEGRASKIVFYQPLSLEGKLTFWNN